MDELRLRAMTAEEFADYRGRTIRYYAAEQVRAGNWPSAQAEELAATATDELLPAGVETPGMLLLVAELHGVGAIGLVWVELEQELTAGAWIYDIQIAPEHRGHGYGRVLLRAAEREVQKRGVNAISLNVFGGNPIALSLYESAGYELTQAKMRKAFTDPSE